MSGPRCLSTLVELPEEGFSPAARARLADRRQLPHRLEFVRADMPALRAGPALRMSISGVQDKLSLRLHRGRFTVTDVGGQYLLKPVPAAPLPAFQHEVPANEHVTMQLAEQCFGIQTAANALVRLADGELAYLTRRFDRTSDGERIAQEDFCQLMARSEATHGPTYKYDSSYEAMGRVLERFAAAYAVEAEALFRRIVFNYVVGNGDAHLKNFSLLQRPEGDYGLSPAYDLLCSTLHLPQESRLALDLFEGEGLSPGEEHAGFVTGSDLRELGHRLRLRPARADAMLARPQDAWDAMRVLVRRSFLSPEAQDAYVSVVRDRLHALAQ